MYGIAVQQTTRQLAVVHVACYLKQARCIRTIGPSTCITEVPNSRLTKQPITIQDVQEASRRIQNYIHRTPVMTSRRIETMAGKKLFFKCELLQKTGSFKIRGATNALCKLLEKQVDTATSNRTMCVVTHSSGNHGQSLAYAAQQLGIKAHIVLPDIAPLCKQQAIEDYGAVKVLCEASEQDREAQKDKIIETTGAIYVPSSQHHDIIAGQATMALELLEQVPTECQLQAIVVPVGGGGMLAGICIAAKWLDIGDILRDLHQGELYFACGFYILQNNIVEKDFVFLPEDLEQLAVDEEHSRDARSQDWALQPGIKIIAAEPKLADDCYQSFHAGKRLPLPKYPDTVADGLRINMGPITWPIIRDLVDDVIVVTENEIKEATKLVWNTMKLCIEPSAGVGVAAVLSNQFQTGVGADMKNVGVILCGGNVDMASISTWIK